MSMGLAVQSSLPIWEIHSQVVATLGSGNRLVLVGPTGSGKTTQVPQMLLDAGLAGDKKIVVLQPRRVAARTVAARVAWERQCKLGQEVGYQIRFDDQTSLGTRICFVTEGILLRWLQDDRNLPDVGIILFDEFHERNLLSDVALALVKQLQETQRPDLKLAVMSATLDAEPVADYLSGKNHSQNGEKARPHPSPLPQEREQPSPPNGDLDLPARYDRERSQSEGMESRLQAEGAPKSTSASDQSNAEPPKGGTPYGCPIL